ncbi:MAG: NAD(P)H-dependent oxidoreductase subunit E [Bacteroidetes bacterium]|jgi:NADH-quinone oxidoreductase subunit E|nr:NAD(P)H-dependent oxidoreductase subunit E [Bacteroidota bacterium]HMT35101.1 NAD(P)H-dependent oxidoreductase subunit E [Chitinophagaceae bacterium]MBK6818656.1 NAD(P)H-dependent oxidoreductase subunit E [Bacteroidota bacterium]MBK7040127.1 NAD(P)H-dependent oxidoreductase subunit E [Bacteroidota bacterium]MBK8330316.1 NAD(P)H-dependent oxidoreductase subunit E [Bacteroidota bacterium]
MAFSQDIVHKINALTQKYPQGKQKSALIPVLHLIQETGNNSLSIEQMDEVASLLQISPIEVYEVATFYTMFNLKPVGKYVLEVCQTGPCMLNGSDEIIEYIKQKLNIKNGETTPDGLFTLKTAECLGACGYAPMMQLGKTYKEFLTPQKIDEILESCRNAAN